MPNPSIPLTRAQIRQQIGMLLNQIEPYAFARLPYDSATSTTIVSNRLKAMPNDANLFNGSTIYLPGLANGDYTAVNYVDTGGFDRSTGTLTVTPGSASIPTSGGVVEIYRKWSRDQIDSAIDMAFVDGASKVTIMHQTAPLVMQTGLYTQREYPIPPEYTWLSHVEWDQNAPLDSYTIKNHDGFTVKTYADSTVGSSPADNTSGIVFAFNFTSATWIHSVAVPIVRVGNPTYGLIAYSGTPGTLSTNVSFDIPANAIDTNPTIVNFIFKSPVYCAANTSYTIWVTTSGNEPSANYDTSNYFKFLLDSTGGYDDPNYTNKGVTTQVSHGATEYDNDSAFTTGTAFSPIFYIFGYPNWSALKPTDWSLISPENGGLVNNVVTYESTLPTYVKFNPATFSPQDGHLLRFDGARAPNDFTRWRYNQVNPTAYSSTSTPIFSDMDTIIPEIDPVFIEYKAASLLAQERVTGQSVTYEDYRSLAQMWSGLAEQHRPIFRLPSGSAKRVR